MYKNITKLPTTEKKKNNKKKNVNQLDHAKVVKNKSADFPEVEKTDKEDYSMHSR